MHAGAFFAADLLIRFRIAAASLADIGVDVAALLCGLFMLASGGDRTMRLFKLPGVLPITGISVAWQYLPIPIAGAVMVFDSILFLTGILDQDDLIYSEKEIDFTDEAAVEALRESGEAAIAKED